MNPRKKGRRQHCTALATWEEPRKPGALHVQSLISGAYDERQETLMTGVVGALIGSQESRRRQSSAVFQRGEGHRRVQRWVLKEEAPTLKRRDRCGSVGSYSELLL